MSETSNPVSGATRRTLIEEGTEFKGTLTSTCPIVVMGRVEGEMTGPSVEVTETGVMSGRAKVTELRSRGELGGEFDAQVVELAGRVRDKTIIRAQSLEVSLERAEGRIEMVFGDCELAVGAEPDKARAVSEALSSGRTRAPAEGPAPAADVAATATSVEEAAPVAAADASPSEKQGRRGKKAAESEQQPDGA